MKDDKLATLEKIGSLLMSGKGVLTKEGLEKLGEIFDSPSLPESIGDVFAIKMIG
jgi:hypothetical protein